MAGSKLDHLDGIPPTLRRTRRVYNLAQLLALIRQSDAVGGAVSIVDGAVIVSRPRN